MFNVKSSLFALALLQTESASALIYDVKKGKCPYKAGQVKSNVSKTLDANKIAGPWMNIFDRNVVHEHKCYGVNFMHSHHHEGSEESRPKVFEYMKSSTSAEKREPREQHHYYKKQSGDDEIENYDEDGNVVEHPDLDQQSKEEEYDHTIVEPTGEAYWHFEDYRVATGLIANFNHPGDQSLAQVTVKDFGEDIRDDEWKAEVEANMTEQEKEDFEKHLKPLEFEAQFERYMQVLDTDYDNYLVMYQCLETARYYDVESGYRIAEWQAHEKLTKKSENSWGSDR